MQFNKCLWLLLSRMCHPSISFTSGSMLPISKSLGILKECMDELPFEKAFHLACLSEPQLRDEHGNKSYLKVLIGKAIF